MSIQPQSRPRSRPEAPVRTRLLSGVVYATVVMTAVALGGWAWGSLNAAAAAIGAREIYALARSGGYRPTAAIGCVLAPALVLVCLWPDRPLDRPLLAMGVMAAFVCQLLRPAGERSAQDWVLTLAGVVYPAIMLGYLVLLRGLPDGRGLAWTALLFGLVWANDSIAYVGGRLFGRSPFFPSLSPKKTAEGALAGLAASLALGLAAPAIGGWVGGALAPLAGLPAWATALVGAAVGVVGPAGDLSESFLKRQVGAKDSGDLIPGHGGLLDRLDSTVFAAPVVYCAAVWLG